MKTIIVDFDGVIHSYVTPWVNARTIPDPPVPGAIEWLERANQRFQVAIVSSRSHQWGGRRAMRRWLKAWAGSLWYEGFQFRGMEEIAFPRHKPPAILTIDDRCFRFDGKFPTLDAIEEFRPWNRQRPSGP